MKEIVNRWVGNTSTLPGIYACSVRYPDKAVFAKTSAQDFPLDALENAGRCVVDTFKVLNSRQLPKANVRFVFEGAFIYCALREDDICLALFVCKDSSVWSKSQIDRLISEFHTLGAPGAVVAPSLKAENETTS